MKQTLSTVIIILTFLLPTVSLGDVNGKGIFCLSSEEDPYDPIRRHLSEKENVYIFQNGMVEVFWINKRETTYVIERKSLGPILVGPDFIKWGYLKRDYNLNRKTLNLSVRGGTYNCEAGTDDYMIKKLEHLKDRLHQEDNSNNQNKI